MKYLLFISNNEDHSESVEGFVKTFDSLEDAQNHFNADYARSYMTGMVASFDGTDLVIVSVTQNRYNWKEGWVDPRTYDVGQSPIDKP